MPRDLICNAISGREVLCFTYKVNICYLHEKARSIGGLVILISLFGDSSQSLIKPLFVVVRFQFAGGFFEAV